ncbi:MAG: glycosyltransferase [Candidatus Hydrogenedentes bacterium]|nr:glycosyltransferase [Candidatus Hydrogenedentota bacterium]
MKICILQVLHTPNDKRVFHKEAKSLAAAGHDVLSIVPSDAPLPEVIDGVRIETTPVAKGMLQRFMASFAIIPRGLRAKADAYLCVEPETWVSGLIIKLLTRRKVVFDQHEHVPSKFADKFPRPFRPAVQWTTVKAMRAMARFTDYVILTKNCLEEPYKGLRVPRAVVLNTNHLQPPCAAIPESLQQRYGHRPTIIHQGLFGDVRGSYQLLDALKILARKCPNIKCILLGKYIYGDEAAFRQAVKEAGLDEHIDMIDEIPFEQVPPYIAVSKVGLILFQPGPMNHTLAMPHKMFDYMREGVPLIAPAFAVEVAHIVRESECGLLVDVADPKAIADAVLRLLQDPEEAAFLGANGRRSVETRYNWQSDERRLLDAFASAARNHHGAGQA